MYKSVLPAAIAAILLSAGSAVAAEGGESEMEMGHGRHYYVVPKLISNAGDKVTHGVETLDGDSSSGYGIDVGFAYGGPWGVELTYTTSKGSVKNDLGVKLGDATYTSMGLMGVYTHHLPHEFSLVGKLGWMQESEKLEGKTSDDSGMAYTLGVEYGVTEKVDVVLEYEGVDVKSPKGNAMMLGAKINL